VIVETHHFKDLNNFRSSQEYQDLLTGVTNSLNEHNNLDNGTAFALRRKSDKVSNGVADLKVPTAQYLVSNKFVREENLGLLYSGEEIWGGVDFIRHNDDGSVDVIEWETGNTSSLSRCLIKIQDAEAGGLNIRSFILIVPHAEFAKHCTSSIVSHRHLIGDGAPKKIWDKFTTPYCGVIYYNADKFIDPDNDSIGYLEKGTDGRSGQAKIKQAEESAKLQLHFDFVNELLEY
jgi:hypothetical protein